MCPDSLTLDFQSDNDSLYVMPLELVPFETPGLSRGRLRMAGALDHVMDVMTDGSGRHGFIYVDDITQKYGAQNFGWNKDGPPHPDLELLKKLKNLTSFDVYSLRILFRTLSIEPRDPDALQLSPSTKASLAAHLKRFTAPLIVNVYGNVSSFDGSDDPIELIRNPDRDTAVKNLHKIADSLEIKIDAIPIFLEKFSDCYLSISYFERYLHGIFPEVTDVAEELIQLKENRTFAGESAFQATCENVSSDMTSLIASTLGKIERFHQETGSMWINLNAQRFYEISELVRSYQVSVAGVLCGLGMKMTEWRSRFATADIGGPTARAEMLMTTLRPGLDKLKEIDQRVESSESLQVE